MLVFWIAAALLTAAAAAVVLWRASRPEAVAADATTEVYRRHLAEQDELLARGLLDETEWKAARAEAARRLLGAARQTAPAGPPNPRRDRLVVLGAVLASALVAVGAYLAVGSPGAPDRPYARRLASWKAADPASLSPPQMAAVLAEFARERPNDPQVWSFLGRARAASGDLIGAARALERAVALNPRSAADWTALGEVLTGLNDGKSGDDAMAAFRRARTLAPDAPEPSYFLGRAEIAAGRRAQGLALWREAAGRLPADDPRRVAIETEIRRAEAGSGSAAEAIAALPADRRRAAIRGMVEGLAARLEASPDDAEGWARLVRAYGVLGDAAARADALGRARSRFRDRPAELALIEEAAK